MKLALWVLIDTVHGKSICIWLVIITMIDDGAVASAVIDGGTLRFKRTV
ncbi:MAG TPA: hypothetical protein VF523_05960 [Burkholderiales bacterium]